MSLTIGLIVGAFFGMLVLGVLTTNKVRELEDENYKLKLKNKAKWIFDNERPNRLVCSNCDVSYDMMRYEPIDLPYCPKCGSDMKEV